MLDFLEIVKLILENANIFVTKQLYEMLNNSNRLMIDKIFSTAVLSYFGFMYATVLICQCYRQTYLFLTYSWHFMNYAVNGIKNCLTIVVIMQNVQTFE
jgi:hypothetical protein